jgi:hypothetical protein
METQTRTNVRFVERTVTFNRREVLHLQSNELKNPKQSPARRRTRRDEIFDFVCAYANEHQGPTPSIHEIALHFKRSYSTIYRHVQRLLEEQRLDYRDGKIIVPDAEWHPPAHYRNGDFPRTE